MKVEIPLHFRLPDEQTIQRMEGLAKSLPDADARLLAEVTAVNSRALHEVVNVLAKLGQAGTLHAHP